MDYEMELYEQLQEVEAELALHGITLVRQNDGTLELSYSV